MPGCCDRNVERCVLADITGYLIGSALHYERTETSEIYIFAVREAVLNYCHELLTTLSTDALSMSVLFANSVTISALVIYVRSLILRTQNNKKSMNLS